MANLNLSMFRAYDIRTPAKLLPPKLALRLARAEATYFRCALHAPGVLVAHDARLGGPEYLQAAAREYTRQGLNVVIVPGACSTPMFYFAAMTLPHLAAVMFGASHNPAGDTGQKILSPGLRPVAQHIGPLGGLDKIKELYVRDSAASNASRPGHVTVYDPCPEYARYSLKTAGIRPGGLKGVRILHDYLHGAAAREMLLAFKLAGARLTPLHSRPDGRFPLGDPNPVKKEVIREGLETLKGGDFQLGIFFDGDGDRMDVYFRDGSYLSSSFVYAGILPLVKKNFKGRNLGIYADLKCNPLALMEMAASGVTTHVIRNGHSQIKTALYEDPSMIGAVEEAAHFYQAFAYEGKRFCTENSLYTALLIAKAWKEKPSRFRRLLAIQASTAREREWGYKFPSTAKMKKAFDAVEAHFAREGAGAINRMENGWPLDGLLMRLGLPFEISASSRLAADWLQVSFRQSHSEDRLARFEVTAAAKAIATDAKAEIGKIVKKYGAGPEYKG